METLKEAAVSKYPPLTEVHANGQVQISDKKQASKRTAFIDGANWQKEQDKAIIVELLEALKDINVYCKGNRTSQLDPLIKKADEAITKANNYLK